MKSELQKHKKANDDGSSRENENKKMMIDNKEEKKTQKGKSKSKLIQLCRVAAIAGGKVGGRGCKVGET